MIVFQTERLLVRKLNFEDAENFFLLNGDEEVMRYIRPVKTREESDQFLKEILAKEETIHGIGRWAAIKKDDGEYVGSFAIIPIENTELIQLGYALLKKHWGKGYATELTKGGLNYYFRTTDASHIYAITETPNLASQKVLMKNGFVFESRYVEGTREVMRFQSKK